MSWKMSAMVSRVACGMMSAIPPTTMAAATTAMAARITITYSFPHSPTPSWSHYPNQGLRSIKNALLSRHRACIDQGGKKKKGPWFGDNVESVPGATLGVLRGTELRNNALEKIVDRLTGHHAG
jgi:hypothetical protein